MFDGHVFLLCLSTSRCRSCTESSSTWECPRSKAFRSVSVFVHLSCCSFVTLLQCLQSVLLSICPPAAVWQDQTVWHADQTPTGPDLPALRPTVEGPRLHRGAAVVPHCSLGHQGLSSRRRLPHDGERLLHHNRDSMFKFNNNLTQWLLSSAGPGSGVHPEASGLLLHQERAELAGRPDPREQEEKGRRQEEEGEGGETDT